MINKPTSGAPEASLLNESPCLAPAVGVTKFNIVTDIILINFVLPLKSDLDVTHLSYFVPRCLSLSYLCQQTYVCKV
jgi:hypothetical protein